MTNVTVYVDTNSNGAYDAGTDTLITYLDQVAADASRTRVRRRRHSARPVDRRRRRRPADRHRGRGDGGRLAGRGGHRRPAAPTPPASTPCSPTPMRTATRRATASISTRTIIPILAAALTATKTSRVISDPFNGTTNPKMIPGAVVEYCVAVAKRRQRDRDQRSDLRHAAGETTYLAAFGIKVNGTVTGGTCNADGVAGGSFAAGAVSAPLSNIAGGVTRTLVFRVTVN